MSKKFCAVVVWILIVAFPSATLVAETSGGMLYARGDVSVNGNRVTRSTALFQGDKVDTAKTGAVSIAMNGSTISLPAESRITYAKDAVNIDCGNAAINTVQGLSARVNGVTISPSARAARYDVVQNGRNVQIAARQGNLSIHTARGQVALASGKALVIPGGCSMMAASYQPQDPPQDQSARKSTSGTANSANSMGNGQTSGYQFVVAAAAIGVTVASVLIFTRGRGEASRSRP